MIFLFIINYFHKKLNEEEFDEYYKFCETDLIYADENNDGSDIYIIDTLIKDLEEKLGLKLFKDSYNIIQENVIIFFNHLIK